LLQCPKNQVGTRNKKRINKILAILGMLFYVNSQLLALI
jgi:hypothetical protein